MINRIELIQLRNDKMLATEKETLNKRFNIAGTYYCESPHGFTFEVKVMFVDDERTIATIQHVDSNQVQMLKIEIDTNGDEMIEAWEYRGFKGYYLA